MATCSQFHHHFTSSFCVNILLPKKKIQSRKASREKLCKAHSYKKSVCKMLMKLPPWVNITKILHKAFKLVDCKSAKMTVKLSVILCFWDLRLNMLVTLTPFCQSFAG
jgi:hypothetical protein